MFYVMGEGWCGKFTFHINTEYPYHLRWRSVHHRHTSVQFQTFRNERDLEQFMDELDRDFRYYEPHPFAEGSTSANLELEQEKLENGE